MTDALLAPIANEFNTINLGDARRNRRLQSVVEALWAHPGLIIDHISKRSMLSMS